MPGPSAAGYTPGMLKFFYTAEDEIPEGLAEHYTETNGKWVLNCEGAVPATRLDEFRTNNVELKKTVEAFGDITPEEAKELKAKRAEIDASKATTPEKIKEEVERRVAAMKTEHDREVEAVRNKLQTTESQLAERTIDAALIEAGGALGLRQSAHADAIARGRTVFKLEDGKPVAYKGDEKLYGKDGSPLSVTEYMAELAKSATHLFDESEGGGAGGGGNGGGGGGGRLPEGGNPWQGGQSWNLTKQAQILKTDRQLAKRLAAQAGVTLRV